MIQFFKKLFAYLFGKKKDAPKDIIPPASLPDHAAKDVIPPASLHAQSHKDESESIFEKYIKKKKEIVHKIPPNYYTRPNSFTYRRGFGHVQQVVVWDGEHFPGRWRTKLIQH